MLLPPLCLLVGGISWWVYARGASWWSCALRSHVGITCGIVAAICALALQSTLLAMYRLCPSPLKSIRRDVRGMAVLEFALLFPIALAVVMIMIQTALLMAGNLVVHYAAFCAARSAIVTVPMNWSDQGEPRNVIMPNGLKLEFIRRAAVQAVAPACAGCPDDSGARQQGSWQKKLTAFFAAGGDKQPSWLNRRSMDVMMAYADKHTQVSIAPSSQMAPADGDDGRLDNKIDSSSSQRYGPTEDLVVTVHHDLILSIPYANRIFGKRLTGNEDYIATQIAATYTLGNQGKYDNVTPEYIPGSPNELLLPR